MIKAFCTLLSDDAGATMVEYGIMVVLIAAMCVAVVRTLGESVSTMFSNVNTSL